jgi:hypothetical protein
MAELSFRPDLDDEAVFDSQVSQGF